MWHPKRVVRFTQKYIRTAPAAAVLYLITVITTVINVSFIYEGLYWTEISCVVLNQAFTCFDLAFIILIILVRPRKEKMSFYTRFIYCQAVCTGSWLLYFVKDEWRFQVGPVFTFILYRANRITDTVFSMYS